MLDGSALRIHIGIPNYYLWSNPQAGQYSDVRMEVDAVRLAGPDENDFGFICRYQDPDNFYYLVASTAGFYKIGKVVGGSESLIGMDNYRFDDRSINIVPDSSGQVSNHLRGDCHGSSLSLYANGTLLAKVEDSDLSSGNIGLIAGSWDTGGVDIRFTHFSTR